MIGIFFTNERVINYETAKTSDLDLFACYYQEMANEGIFLPPSQFEGMFCRLRIQMKILKRRLKQRDVRLQKLAIAYKASLFYAYFFFPLILIVM